MDSRRGRWWAVALAGGLVAAATLPPGSDAAARAAGFWCLACGDFGVADAVANVVLFVPLGWALWRAGLRPGQAIALMAATTIAIELAQSTLIPGRVGSASDVITNVAGGILGFTLPAGVRWLRGSPGRAARGAIAYAALLGAGICAGVMLQAIARPEALRWHRESPRLPGYTDFTGVVRAVRINDTTVAAGDVVARGAREESTTIALDVVSGVADPRRAEIISAMPNGGPAWGWIDQEGRDLRAHLASTSDRLRLRGHAPWLTAAMPAAAGESVTLRLIGRRYAYALVVVRGATTLTRRASISPADGWRLFMPFERKRERIAPLLSALWMAALLAPLGLLAAGRSAAAVGGAGAGAAAYLVLLPLALGCAWLPLAGWCGAGGGFLIGKAAASWTS